MTMIYTIALQNEMHQGWKGAMKNKRMELKNSLYPCAGQQP